MVLPALRDRFEDLGTLIAAILPRLAPEPERITLHRSAAHALFRYAWPLNIRELEQALLTAAALTDTGGSTSSTSPKPSARTSRAPRSRPRCPKSRRWVSS